MRETAAANAATSPWRATAPASSATPAAARAAARDTPLNAAGMSSLTNIEKRKFERLFGMGTGYVLDFSNRTFSDFVLDSTGREIYDNRYDGHGSSKAEPPSRVLGRRKQLQGRKASQQSARLRRGDWGSAAASNRYWQSVGASLPGCSRHTVPELDALEPIS